MIIEFPHGGPSNVHGEYVILPFYFIDTNDDDRRAIGGVDGHRAARGGSMCARWAAWTTTRSSSSDASLRDVVVGPHRRTRRRATSSLSL